MIEANRNKLKMGTKGWEYGKLYLQEFLGKNKPTSLIFPIVFCVISIWLLEYYFWTMMAYIDMTLIAPSPGIFWAIIALIGSYMLSAIIRYSLWKMVFLRTINFYDKYLIVAVCAFVIHGIGHLLLYSEWWKVYLAIVVLSLFLLTIKVKMYQRGQNAALAKAPNIITLNDLYYHRIPKKDLILLAETAIVNKDEDLLGIVPFVDFIRDALSQVIVQSTHVIALTGKWGCGKTSIINLLQSDVKEDEQLIIATFSPWQYEDTYTLFKGFYDFIFKNFGDNFNYINSKEYFRKYRDILFDYVKEQRKIPLADFFASTATDIAQMRELISDKIKSEDKKMIIVIDDIDRLNKAEILFIFKIIQTIFNFDHLVYVLSFDEARVNRIFQEEFKTDKNYLDKIIQTKINVPQIHNDVIREIGQRSILNMIQYYNVVIADMERLHDTLNIVFKNFSDLRDLIRYLNSVSTIIKNMQILHLSLDVSDLIALEYVKYADLGLYYELSSQACFLISEDIEYNLTCNIVDDVFATEEQFNQQGSGKFKELFTNQSHIVEVLAEVFPNVQAYRHGGMMMSKGSSLYDEDINPSFLLQRCYNGCFFDVYFTIRDNAFTQLNKTVEQFIDEINFINVDDSHKLRLDAVIGTVDMENQRLLLKVIKERIAEIDDVDKLFALSINLEDLYEKYEATAILFAAIIKKEQEHPHKYITALAEKDLRMLESVLSLLDLDFDAVALTYGEQIMNSKLEQREEEKYDLFSKEEYKRGSGRLYSSPHYRGDREKIEKRLVGLVNQENIFRVIAEYVQQFADFGSDKISYYYDTASDKIVPMGTIERTLKNGFYELNADQERVKQIYEAAGDTVVLDAPINFDNL